MASSDPRSWLYKVVGACLALLVGAAAFRAVKLIEAVDADIVSEFVEPGNSAQTIDNRPVFRQLLQSIADNPGIDYVII